MKFRLKNICCKVESERAGERERERERLRERETVRERERPGGTFEGGTF